MLLGVLDNQPGPARDIVLLNAGAAIYVGEGCAETLAEGHRAQGARDSSIENGTAREQDCIS